jgi:Legume lectin domain
MHHTRTVNHQAKRFIHYLFALVLLFLAACQQTPAPQAEPALSTQATTTITFNDFADVSVLTLNGDAAQAGTVLRLAPAASNKRGSVYLTSPVQIDSFQSRFQFLFHDFSRNTSDGMTFVIQSQGVDALGELGNAKGYEGVKPSIAVFFDTESGCGQRVGFAINGSSVDGCPAGLAAAPFDLYGSPVTVWVDYDAPSTTLSVFMAQDGNKPAAPLFTRTVNIGATVGTTAYVGFTAATGQAYMDHDLLNWTFTAIPNDLTPPVITPTVTGTLGNNAWYTSDVNVSFSVVDEESAISNQTNCAAQTVTTDTAGVTFTCTATSAGGTSSQTVTVKRDATAPSLTPVVSPNPVIIKRSATVTSNASDALSGLASQSCGTLDTNSVGSKSVSCSATDNAGNTTSASAAYGVIYNFKGFFIPVQNAPALNTVKAGWVVPFSFTLGGNFGRTVISKTESTAINCSTLAAQGSASATQQGSSSLQDAEQMRSSWSLTGSTLTSMSNFSSGSSLNTLYIYLWKTDKSWKNTCRQFTMTLNDGTQHKANFKFK